MMLRNDRDGFALPMAILLIGFMTAGVLAGFARSSSEVLISNNQNVETAAFAMAEAGLSEFLGLGNMAVAGQTFSYDGGEADVTLTLVQAGATATDPSLWLVRSTSRLKAPVGQPAPSRTVAQLAVRNVATMQVLSSWTSLSGLIKNGAAGDITGYDAAPVPCSSEGSKAGVATPTALLTGKDDAITGTPAHLPMGTVAEAAAAIQIDWVNIAKPVNPAIQPDHVVCMPGGVAYDPDYTNCGSWPSTSKFTNPDYWPVILVNGDTPLPSDGRGVLIVTGDLTFKGGDKWDGIILVGGKIVDNGSGNIAGAVVSGLNVLKGMDVGESSKANGTKDYSYDSCAVQNAANGMSRLNAITNAWADNLSTW